MHSITAPIESGGGDDLPGLLGLKSLEQERAILDCGARMLHLVGKGDAQLQLPPGSLSIPLRKAPSGHLVMVIDEYDKVSEQKGCVAEASLQLHTESSTSASSSTGPTVPRAEEKVRTVTAPPESGSAVAPRNFSV